MNTVPFLISKVSVLSGLQFGLKVVVKAAIYFFPFKSEAAVCDLCAYCGKDYTVALCDIVCLKYRYRMWIIFSVFNAGKQKQEYP